MADELKKSTDAKRIKQNYWGNWNGYRGTKKVVSFGTDNIAAKEWVAE